jgi:hypothetical protein
MSAKHTPGPWSSDGSHIYAPDGEIIAQVHNPGSKEADYPLVQNRNLMTAAPELLEALKALLALKTECPCEISNEAQATWGQAARVFAKAEGGTHD